MNGPRLFYFCFDHNRPSGGVKQIYRHVDILNRHGCDAQVLHSTPGFRVTWFANQTRTTDLTRLQTAYDRTTDFIVVPEDLGVRMMQLPGRKVVFNQNVYYGLAGFANEPIPLYPYLSSEIVAVFTVSEHNTEYLRFGYPNLKIHRIWYGVDQQRFTYCPLAGKRKQIACVVKTPLELYTLYHLLRARGQQGLSRLNDYQWIFLIDKSEQEIAAILHDALVLLFLSTTEGLPLMPLEGLLSGCLVAAFDVGPLREYLPAAFRFPAHDLLGAARWLETIAGAFPERIDEWQPVCQAGYAAAQPFTLEREEQSVLDAWRQILRC
jgi:glycosyltransferase involved in cell wall biosynthesis